MGEGRRRDYLLEYLREVVRPSMPILPYGAAAARWHGRVRAQLEAKGRPTSFADGQIAGIAATEGLTVVTRNTADFEPVANLSEMGGPGAEIRLENWFAR
jgi:tRNA(fMet)-specific endonuclease VapC